MDRSIPTGQGTAATHEPAARLDPINPTHGGISGRIQDAVRDVVRPIPCSMGDSVAVAEVVAGLDQSPHAGSQLRPLVAAMRSWLIYPCLQGFELGTKLQRARSSTQSSCTGGRDEEAGDYRDPVAIDPRIRGTVNGIPCTASGGVDQSPRAGNSG